MGLSKATGDMYGWVTHTWNPVGGECPHRCSYCYVRTGRLGGCAKYQGPQRLIEKEMKTNLGKGNTIFVCSCNDLFAGQLHHDQVMRVLSLPGENVYVFQSKNPAGMILYESHFPPNSLLGTTIETNEFIYTGAYSRAPFPVHRAHAMSKITLPKFLSIEPIMDFSFLAMLQLIRLVNPDFISIGADSRHCNLPEPSGEKIRILIENIQKMKIEVRQKKNLDRLLKEA